MAMIGKGVLSIVLTFLAVLIAADLVGVLASFILDVAPARHKSAGLGYAIWLVLGVFAGVIAFGMSAGTADDGPKPPASERRARGRLILTVAIVLVAALNVAFWMLFWGGGTGAEFAVVPDHMPTTIVFFVSFLGACFLGFKLETDEVRPPPGRRGSREE